MAQNYGAGDSPISVAVADFNGDGRLDLAVANQLSDDVSVFLGNGDGSFQAPRTFPAGSFAWSMAAGDFNRDGRPDLAIANQNSNNVSVLINNTGL